MENITFFAKPSFYRVHLFRGSSMIRAEQIAERMEAQLNPVVIWVKPNNLDRVRDDDWVDVIDGIHLPFMLKSRPHVGIIACSKSSYRYMKEMLPNKIIYIPQHHCNFNREKRTRTEIKRVGFVATRSGFTPEVPEIKRRMAKIGLEFDPRFHYKDREEVVEYYKTIDLQMVWAYGDRVIKNPLKLINAASFGIPTVAKQIKAYEEFEGFYVPVHTMEELYTEIEKFKNVDYYNEWSNKVFNEAEKYHIDNIAKMYKQL